MSRYRGARYRRQHKPKPAPIPTDNQVRPIELESVPYVDLLECNRSTNTTLNIYRIGDEESPTPKLKVRNRYDVDLGARFGSLILCYGKQIYRDGILRIAAPSKVKSLRRKGLSGRIIAAKKGSKASIEVASIGIRLSVEVKEVFVLSKDGPENMSLLVTLLSTRSVPVQ